MNGSVGPEARGCGLSGGDQCHGSKGGDDLQVCFAAKERPRDEVEAGALRQIAKKDTVKELDGEKMNLRAWKGTDFSCFWNANKGAPKAERVRQNGDRERNSQRAESRASHRSEKRIVAVPPDSLPYAQEPDGRQHHDRGLADARELSKERGDGKIGGE